MWNTKSNTVLVTNRPSDDLQLTRLEQALIQIYRLALEALADTSDDTVQETVVTNDERRAAM